MDPGAEDQLYTIDFRLINEKVVVRAKVNDGSFQDFVVDTGAENTVLSRPTAQRLGITPITYTLSAGVGDVGIRGLQLARINTLELGPLKLRNVPCMIKDPPLRDLPVKEAESLSPLALGFSMIIDYKTRKITFGRHLPEEKSDIELPLRLHRLATVRGMVDGTHTANFVVDTGGEVISISRATASALGRPEPARKIALKVFGSSGWDKEAFLMPGVDLSFDTIRYTNFPVVVLNLNTPSALLGFQLGGIVGHKFLSRYRVGIDLEKSVLRLRAI
jgi:predicted aspartyl protease